ncbi:CDP-alcohol phosphatidyltransferase family protein [Rhizobium sp. FKY42]|uniref:CDP-alcohol phosphatidyltransferase family protein n=1 Tax=Rhizobium sp. FKY42 TaxID=2562310 RepID=UPI0010C12303|nr:CDP-alcohol phosphatidyltransferase family protein [Rhizobium sp. FKY42]
MTILDSDRRSSNSLLSALQSFDVGRRLLTDTLRSMAVIFTLSLLGSVGFAYHYSLEPAVPLAAAGLLAVMFGLALCFLPQHRHTSFGYANIVTAIRAAATSFVAATILLSDAFADSDATGLVWAVFTITVVALTLDGFDGYLARRFNHVSEFGARFDMEVDAFLILMLSCAAFVLGKAGAWVLLIGAMRYMFILGQLALPALNQPLGHSFRRKLVCVIQVLALGIVLVPLVVAPMSAWILAIALLALVYSFAVDIVALVRRSYRPVTARG